MYKRQGLHGVDLVVSDHHNGLIRAIRQYFQGATWQRCQTHFMRNILDKIPKALQKEIPAKVRAIFEAPDAKTARMLLNQVLDEYRACLLYTSHLLVFNGRGTCSIRNVPGQ